MSAPTPVARALTDLGIPHRVFVHSGIVNSLEQAAAERDQRPEQVVRSILFRISAGEYAMVLIAGPSQVDWKALRRHLGARRLTMASEVEVLAVTGYPPGAVAPVGVAHPLKILIDRSLLGQQEISLGSGTRGSAIIMQSNDLIQILQDSEIGDFAQQSPL